MTNTKKKTTMNIQKEDLRRFWQNKVQPKIKIIFNIPNYIERK